MVVPSSHCTRNFLDPARLIDDTGVAVRNVTPMPLRYSPNGFHSAVSKFDSATSKTSPSLEPRK